MKLADFDVTIDSHYATEARSPAGTAAGHLDLDIAAPLFQAAWAEVRGPAAGRVVYQRFGHLLYEALFHGPVRDCWQQSLARTIDNGHADYLRVRLFIKDADLAALPWELLWSPERLFLATAPRLTLSRYVPVLEPPPALEVERLRLLLVIAGSAGAPLLTPTEIERLTNILTPVADCHILLNPSPAEIHSNLSDNYHALHFLYPADPVQAAGQAPDESGLVRLLQGPDSARLVVLNACHQTPNETGDEFFGNLGPALVRAGRPAVLALQHRSAEAALTFSRAFYSALAKSRAVDVAVTEGRQLLSAGPLLDSRDWHTPTLYLGARSHEILQARRAGAPPARAFAVTPARRRDNRERILTRLCNRQTEEHAFYQFLSPHVRHNWGVPQICVLRGGDSERHDSLIERLTAVGLREEAQALWGQAYGVTTGVEKLGWEFADDLPQRKYGLLVELFQAFQVLDEQTGELSAQALRRALKDKKIKFAVARHRIPLGEWDQTTAEAVKWYLSFWRELAQDPDPAGPHFIIFLDFVYDDSRAASFWQRLRRAWRVKRARRVLDTHVSKLSGKQPGLPLLSLADLPLVSLEEVKEWLRKYTIYDDSEIPTQAEYIFPPATRRLSLAEIEAKLEEIPAAQLKEGAIDDVRNEFRFLRRQWHNA